MLTYSIRRPSRILFQKKKYIYIYSNSLLIHHQLACHTSAIIFFLSFWKVCLEFHFTSIIFSVKTFSKTDLLSYSRLDGITNLMDLSLSELRELVMDRERPGMLQFMGLQRVGHDWGNELDWTEPAVNCLTRTKEIK